MENSLFSLPNLLLVSSAIVAVIGLLVWVVFRVATRLATGARDGRAPQDGEHRSGGDAGSGGQWKGQDRADS